MRKVLISEKNEFDHVSRGDYRQAAAVKMLAKIIKASEKPCDSEDVQTSKTLSKASKSAKA